MKGKFATYVLIIQLSEIALFNLILNSKPFHISSSFH